MPLINNAFSIIALLISTSALINKAFIPMLAHWWRIGALIDRAFLDRAMLQLDRATRSRFDVSKNRACICTRLYAVSLYQSRLI